jgi:hypothetical protein
MIRKTTIVLAAVVLAGGVLATDAQARGGGGGLAGAGAGISQRPAIINDPALFGPPQQPTRNFVGPAPSMATPMRRVPPVAPLATPPLR